MNVKDLLDPSKPPKTVKEEEDVASALKTMIESDIRHLPVLRDGLLSGVVSKRDVFAHQARRGPQGDTDLVSTMMTSPVLVAHPGMEVGKATKVMLAHRIGCLPVLDGRKLVGIVTRTDLLRASFEPRG